jgi:hypothetical protein
MEARHKKTGNKYLIINDNVINATNINDGQLMILYCGKRKNSDSIEIFVRERLEFLEKFKIIS